MINHNDRTMIMLCNMNKTIQKGCIVNLKCKMQRKHAYYPTEVVAVYIDSEFQFFLSMHLFIYQGPRGEQVCLDVTDYVSKPGYVSPEEMEAIKMVYPERFQ